jgi:hypothetical protein
MGRREFQHLPPWMRHEAKVLEALGGSGGRTTKRELQRRMNMTASDLQMVLDPLMKTGCVRLESGDRRSVVVHLLRVPIKLSPLGAKPKRKRMRPRTEWFQERLPEFRERDGYLDDERSEGPESDMPEGCGDCEAA